MMANIGIVTYTMLFYCLLPFALLRLAYRGLRAPDYFKRWPERFGFFSGEVNQPSIWIHAVSVGELQAAIPVIRALQANYAAVPIVVTTTTPTGLARAQAEFGETIIAGHIPYDTPGAVRRFLQNTQPKIAIIMETELWPNLFDQCLRRNVPVAVINARLSERSARGYRRFAKLIRFTLDRISWIAAQNESDGQRFLSLGLAPERLSSTGNVKFDQAISLDAIEQGEELKKAIGKRPVWIAASTHEGEDEAVLQAFRVLKQRFPDLFLILVPRHPERFKVVREKCINQEWKVVQRSTHQALQADTDILLGDTMGELMGLYAASDIAFVGGSLVPTGGHNMLEPAALGLPTITGKHTFNFAEITEQLLAIEAAQQIKDAHELADVVTRFLKYPNLKQQAGSAGQQWINANKGATARVVERLDELINHE